MFSTEQYVAKKFEFSISGKATKEDAAEFKRYANTHDLVLNYARGWDGSIVDFIEAFKGVEIRHLSVFARPSLDIDVDITPLNTLSTLSKLSVAGQVVGQLNLDNLPLLASFGFGGELKGKRKVKLDWGKCLNLQSTGGLVSKLPSADTLATFPKLNSLVLVKLNWKPEELQKITGLVDLNVSYWSELESLAQLGTLIPSLKKLQLYQASKLLDYSAIARMTSLKTLGLSKCPAIPSVRLFQNLQQLEELWLPETKIVDGDLSALMLMPSLRHIALIDQKKNHPSRTEIESFLSKRHN